MVMELKTVWALILMGNGEIRHVRGLGKASFARSHVSHQLALEGIEERNHFIKRN